MWISCENIPNLLSGNDCTCLWSNRERYNNRNKASWTKWQNNREHFAIDEYQLN